MENRDQMYQLRKIVSRAENQKGRIIAVTSGKGGVGKSAMALNLSLAFMQEKKRVLLIDADHSLPDLHVLLGLAPRKRLRDALTGEKALSEVISADDSGLHVVFSGRSDIKEDQVTFHSAFFDEVKGLRDHYEIIVVDTAAGISEPVVNLGVNADDVLVVATPEPAAISDSYALVKVLSGMDKQLHFHTLINRVENEAQALEVNERFQLVIDHFLNIKHDFWGYVTEDKHLRMAAEQQLPLLSQWPKSQAAKCIYQIARDVSL